MELDKVVKEAERKRPQYASSAKWSAMLCECAHRISISSRENRHWK
jgi:hypothetical protein